MSSFQFSTAVRALIRVARPEFRRRADRVAYAVHAYYLCQGYTLVGVGAACEETVPPGDAAEVPIDGWNENGELYTFAYSGAKEMPPVMVKCIGMGNVMVVCVSSLLADGSEPRTMNVNVEEVTTDSDEILQGYTSLESLVEQISKELGEFKDTSKKGPSGNPPSVGSHQPRWVEPAPLERPGLGGIVGGGVPSGGNLIGMRDPRFAPHLRHPELRPGMGGVRFDPIGPEGTPGYHPDDFRPSRHPFHPDLAPPGPRPNYDPDNMFG